MIVLRNGLNVYKPKLSIESGIILEQIYGSVTSPIEKSMPSLSEQVFLLSLCLSQYNLSEDELYELIDGIDDLFSLILDLYTEAGLINQDTEQNSVDSQETVDNSKIEDTPQSFEEMCDETLIQCMSMGLSKEQFYNSTFKEVKQYSEAYQQQQKNRLEEQAFFDWQLANLIGSSVARLLSKEAKYPTLHEAYPFLDDTQPTEEVGEDGLTPEERAVIINQEKMREWVEAMNKKRKQKETKECE